MKTYLVVPFKEKDDVKRLGAQWEAGTKRWFVQDTPDLRPFMKWIPAAQKTQGDNPPKSKKKKEAWKKFLAKNDKRYSRLNGRP